MNRNIKHKMPSNCPVCQSRLEISRLTCNSCNTILEGNFQLYNLGKLSSEEQAFIEIFIKCRGSIKEVEKELGISYPTVCKRLDEVIKALGYKSSGGMSKTEILEAIESGKISAKEGAELLKGL